MANIVKPPCDEGVIRSARDSTPCPGHLAAWILAATILGSSMVFIDGSVVNVALPVIQIDLHADVAGVQWVVEAYALFLAALILVGGSLGDRFGRRRMFATGIIIFAGASLVCGLSQQVSPLIVGRAIQGVGGALLTPESLAIISASFSQAQRGRAIGTWSAFTSITAALGPVVGGFLVDHYSWRWAFFLNLPLALIVLAICLWRLPESRDEDATARLDWSGAFAATLGLGGVVYGCIQATTLGLSHPLVLGAVTGGSILLIVFVALEARSANPMMPLGLLRARSFGGANLLTLLLYAALSGVLFFVPFDLIQVQGYSATAAGASLLPVIVLMFLLSRWSGGLVGRYGAKLPLIAGPAIAGLGFALFAVPGIGGSYWTTFFPAAVVLGLGMAISVAPLTTVVMNSVDPRHAGLASGINNAVSRTAGLLAITLASLALVLVFSATLDSRLAALNLQPETQKAVDAQRIQLAATAVPAGVSDSVATQIRRAIDDSFVTGFRFVALIGAGLALASALSAWFMIEGQPAVRRERLVPGVAHRR